MPTNLKPTVKPRYALDVQPPIKTSETRASRFEGFADLARASSRIKQAGVGRYTDPNRLPTGPMSPNHAASTGGGRLGPALPTPSAASVPNAPRPPVAGTRPAATQVRSTQRPSQPPLSTPTPAPPVEPGIFSDSPAGRPLAPSQNWLGKLWGIMAPNLQDPNAPLASNTDAALRLGLPHAATQTGKAGLKGLAYGGRQLANVPGVDRVRSVATETASQLGDLAGQLGTGTRNVLGKLPGAQFSLRESAPRLSQFLSTTGEGAATAANAVGVAKDFLTKARTFPGMRAAVPAATKSLGLAGRFGRFAKGDAEFSTAIDAAMNVPNAYRSIKSLVGGVEGSGDSEIQQHFRREAEGIGRQGWGSRAVEGYLSPLGTIASGASQVAPLINESSDATQAAEQSRRLATQLQNSTGAQTEARRMQDIERRAGKSERLVSDKERGDYVRYQQQQRMTPAERETQDLGVVDTTLSNAMTRPIASPSDVWHGRSVNPMTSRPVRLSNLGGFLPW